MNKMRRKELYNVSNLVANVYNNIKDDINQINIITSIQQIIRELENIKSDEEDYMYNIPENMQSGSRYADAEEACDNMDMAINYLYAIVEDEQCTTTEIMNTLNLCIPYINKAAI